MVHEVFSDHFNISFAPYIIREAIKKHPSSLSTSQTRGRQPDAITPVVSAGTLGHVAVGPGVLESNSKTLSAGNASASSLCLFTVGDCGPLGGSVDY